MSSTTLLIVVGITMEVAGLGLVSAEDLGWERGREALSSARSRLIERLRAKLGMAPTSRTSVSVSDSIALREYAAVVHDVDPTADVESQLAFLRAEVVRAQERMNELAARIEEEHALRVTRLNELRQEINDAIGEGVESSRLRFVRLRRFGIVLLWIGGACLAAANLV